MEDLNKNTYIKNLLFFILILKFCWIILLIIKMTIQKYSNSNSDNLQIIEYTEDITHGIYNITIGLLLIYLYNHLTTKRVCISGKVKKYLYSYGILMIIGNVIDMIHRHN